MTLLQKVSQSLRVNIPASSFRPLFDNGDCRLIEVSSILAKFYIITSKRTHPIIALAHQNNLWQTSLPEMNGTVELLNSKYPQGLRKNLSGQADRIVQDAIARIESVDIKMMMYPHNVSDQSIKSLSDFLFKNGRLNDNKDSVIIATANNRQAHDFALINSNRLLHKSGAAIVFEAVISEETWKNAGGNLSDVVILDRIDPSNVSAYTIYDRSVANRRLTKERRIGVTIFIPVLCKHENNNQSTSVEENTEHSLKQKVSDLITENGSAQIETGHE